MKVSSHSVVEPKSIEMGRLKLMNELMLIFCIIFCLGLPSEDKAMQLAHRKEPHPNEMQSHT